VERYCIASIKDLRIAPSPAVQRREFTLDPTAAIGGTVIDAQVRVAPYSGRARGQPRKPL